MDFKNKNFTNTQGWSMEELNYLIDLAFYFRKNGVPKLLQGKAIALLFFNPSLRTRTSMEVAIYRLGGHASIIHPGKDAWQLEIREGVIMDNEAEEHIKEAIKVLSFFYDCIAIRAFPKFHSWEEDRKDLILNAVLKWANKPIINMETIIHPLQELALMMELKNHFKELIGKKFLLTWTYHPRGLNTAVANSAIMIATRLGMEVTILRPPNYDLDDKFLAIARSNAAEYGNEVHITEDIESAYRGADFVYAKSWGSLSYFSRWEEEKHIREKYKNYIVSSDKMRLTNNAYFSHCLPLRRNVKATDEVVDSDYSLVYEEAENRLYTACALLSLILSDKEIDFIKEE